MDFTKDDLELLAAGLLGGKQNLGQNLSQGLLLMRQGRTEREDRAQRQQAMQMQQEMQRMQLDQAKQAQQDQQNISGVLGQYFRPAQAQQTAPFQADMFPGEAPIQGLQTITQQARPAVADFQGASSALMGLGTPAAVKEGLQIMQYAQKQKPKFADINPKDFTPESVRKFETTGQFGDLVPFRKQEGDVANLNATLDAAGITDPTQRQQFIRKFLDKKTTHQPGNQMIVKQEAAEAGAFGAHLVKDVYAPAQERAKAVRKENSLLTALENNPIDTNAAAPLTATASAWLSSAGIGGEQLKQVAGNAQLFNAVAKDLVLQKQLAQKGPQTDSDAKRLEATVASLGNTKEANKAIIRYAKALNNYDIEYADFLRNYRAKNNTINGAEDAWFNGPGARSIWDDPLLKGYTGAAAQQPSASSGFSIRKLPNG